MSGAPGVAAPWRLRRATPPIPGESLDGYVARVAAAEHIPRAIEITSLGGVRHPHYADLGLTGWSSLPLVADCLRIDVAELELRSYPASADGLRRRFNGAWVDRRMLQTKTRRFAPAALDKSPHHRALWQLRTFPFCEETWQLLTDRCPSAHCGAVQRWHHTAGVHLCDMCGAPLRQAPAPPVPAELHEPLRLALGLVHHEPARRAESIGRLPSALRTIGTGEILDLLSALAVMAVPALAGRRGARRIRGDADKLAVCAAVARGSDLLEGWPERVEALAAERLATRDGRSGDGNGGATLKLLAMSSAAGVPPRLQALVAGLDLRMRTNDGSGVEGGMAAAMTRLSVQRIVQLRRAMLLPTVFHLRNGLPLPLLERAAVERMASDIRSSVRITHAAAELGVTYHGVEQLIASRALGATTPLATRTQLTPLRVDGASLKALQAAVVANASGEGDAHWPPLRSVMGGFGGGLKAWGPVITGLADGSIAFALAAGGGALVDRIRIRPDHVGTVLGCRFDRASWPDFPFSEGMSRADAAETLNLHHRKAAGALAAWPSPPGCVRSVPVGAVEEMASACVSHAEIAGRLGISRARAQRHAAELGLRGGPAGYNRSVCKALGISYVHDDGSRVAKPACRRNPVASPSRTEVGCCDVAGPEQRAEPRP